jgi:hypothetical protein
MKVWKNGMMEYWGNGVNQWDSRQMTDDRQVLNVRSASALCHDQFNCQRSIERAKVGANLVFAPELPVVLLKAVFDTGFQRHTGCFPGDKNNCFWLSLEE